MNPKNSIRYAACNIVYKLLGHSRLQRPKPLNYRRRGVPRRLNVHQKRFRAAETLETLLNPGTSGIPGINVHP